MSSRIKKSILKLKESSTLVINERSKALIKEGKKVYQFGFGQSPFPVPEKIVEALKNNAHRKEYLPVQGLPKLREVISKDLEKKTGNNYPKENILITPGSKEAMLLMHIAFKGEIIIPVLKNSFLIISIGMIFSVFAYEITDFSLLGENRSLGKILMFMFAFTLIYYFTSIPFENESLSHIIGVFILLIMATFIIPSDN